MYLVFELPKEFTLKKEKYATFTLFLDNLGIGLNSIIFEETSIKIRYANNIENLEDRLIDILKKLELDSIKDWEPIRKNRTFLLEEADIKINILEDAGLETKELRAYRQALRDITKQEDPDNVVWPEKPW